MWMGMCLCIMLVKGSSSFVNVAHTPEQSLQGRANMSEPPQKPGWSASKAVDGNVNQFIPNCAVMNFNLNYKSVWWKVRLQKRYNIAYLEVYLRENTIRRATGYSLYSYDSTEVFDFNQPDAKNLIYHHNPMSGCPASIQNITVNRLGQEIVFINNRPAGYTSTCQDDDLNFTGVELCEVKVMGCDTNRYSSNQCRQLCSVACKNRTCDAFNGSCIYGCSNPKALTINCIVCKDGDYISNGICVSCQGHCKVYCNKLTGRCDYGCENHWEGDFCNVCSPYYYGEDCNSLCGQCSGYDVCDNMTGRCPNGCQKGWQNSKCDVCEDGYYNENCTALCGKCLNATHCDKETGTCKDGCQPHFRYPFCKECSDGYYGNDCIFTCTNCNKTSPGCVQSNGYCLSGCESDEWMAPKCDVSALEKQENADGRKLDSGSIVGGVLTVILVITTIGVLGFLFKRRQLIERKKYKEENTKTNPNHAMSKWNEKQPDTGCKGHYTIEVGQEDHSNEAFSGDNQGYYNAIDITTYIRVKGLQSVILQKNVEESKIFLSEYKRLPPGDMAKCTTGKQQENITKNRFKTTFPYDHSRVILREQWTDKDNDYINANYIKDYNGERAYIAAQGPKKITLVDFCRMIWQENVSVIVMLTNITENGKNKCTQYWPEKKEVMDVGPCKIKLLEETVYAFYTYRKFTMQQNNSNKRTITQFHYTAWPDHGTPEELGLVQFQRAVTKKNHTGGLMLVHCSAGVGRTGTFIALDSLLKEGQQSERINVFEFVKTMREDRMTMVQTAEQYVFLHKALLCALQEKGTVVDENDIPEIFASLLQDKSPLNQRTLFREYQFLQTLKPTNDDKEKDDGGKPENKEKNINLNILPASKYRPYLTSYVEGRNDYINAVFLPSFTSQKAFIITQYPLKDTEVDLWRLCMDHDVHALVILHDDTEGVSWIPQNGTRISCQPFFLSPQGVESSMNSVSQGNLLITVADQEKELLVYIIPVGDQRAMLRGVELLLEHEKQKFTSVILSKDGAETVGIFCVVHNVLQQLRMDKEVDIFTAVRQIQTRRPEVITKLDEYESCYELVLLSTSQDQIYANI